VLVGTLQDQLAGARLNLQDDTTSMPVTIKSVALVAVDEGPVDQLFSVVVDVEGIAQFSGANAQLGG
jgi:hypothetical protein